MRRSNGPRGTPAGSTKLTACPITAQRRELSTPRRAGSGIAPTTMTGDRDAPGNPARHLYGAGYCTYLWNAKFQPGPQAFTMLPLSLIHISEPTRLGMISYA